MIEKEKLIAQIPYSLTAIELPELGKKIAGKVRDSFVLSHKAGYETRVLITSDRLSAFDVILASIPFKGQVLNAMAAHWFELTKDLVPNHIIAQPHPNVFIGRQVKILPIEVIVRGYLTGSAWRDYEAGRAVSGITLPKGMKRSQAFDSPLLTPSTKAEMGKHDEPISCEEIVSSGIVEKKLWEQVEEAALKLFAFGQKKANEQGLILVDTKYEFGVLEEPNGKLKLVLADEVHTSDSSRYWILSSYKDRFEAGEDPQMLDKEFVRRYLIEQGFMGEGTPPKLSNDFLADTALRYIEACEKITGKSFAPTVGEIAGQIKALVPEILSIARG